MSAKVFKLNYSNRTEWELKYQHCSTQKCTRWIWRTKFLYTPAGPSVRSPSTTRHAHGWWRVEQLPDIVVTCTHLLDLQWGHHPPPGMPMGGGGWNSFQILWLPVHTCWTFSEVTIHHQACPWVVEGGTASRYCGYLYTPAGPSVRSPSTTRHAHGWWRVEQLPDIVVTCEYAGMPVKKQSWTTWQWKG